MRLAALVFACLLPVTSQAACPASLVGTYSAAYSKASNLDGFNNGFVGVFQFAAPAKTGLGTVTILWQAYAETASASGDTGGGVTVTNKTSMYRFDKTSCRAEIYLSNSDDVSKYDVKFGVVAGSTVYFMDGPTGVALPAALDSGGTTWSAPYSFGIGTAVKQ
jgi:hypothetical protein